MNIKESDVTIRTKFRGEEITLKGVVDRTGSVLNQNTRFVDVIIKPKADNWDILVPGVFVEVDLIGKSVENVWVIPNEAMQGQNDIWIVNQDNTLKQFKPQIITTGDESTDAIGNGENVDVVLGLLKGASEGMTVRVTEQQKNNQMRSAPPSSNQKLIDDNTSNRDVSAPITSPIETNEEKMP